MCALFLNIPEVTSKLDFTWLLPFLLMTEGPLGRAPSRTSLQLLTVPPDFAINLGHFLFSVAHD